MENKEKFTGKAEIYDKYRPVYPDGVYDFIINGFGLREDAVFADIGAGTGKFCMPLLERGYKVYCIEPNADMMAKLEKKACGLKNFTGINSTADHTRLPENSVDIVTVAQAFHWFDRQAFRNECRRILKPHGKVVLLWNVKDEECALIKDINELNKKFCPEYKGFSGGIDHVGCEQFDDFFQPTCKMKILTNNIYDDNSETFIGRCLSSSYALKEDNENYGEYKERLGKLFLKHAYDGRTEIKNDTVIYWGGV